MSRCFTIIAAKILLTRKATFPILPGNKSKFLSILESGRILFMKKTILILIVAITGFTFSTCPGWAFKDADLRQLMTRKSCVNCDLSEVYLGSGVDLNEAILVGANLTNANLTGAHLRGANFGNADLSKALLYGADLSGAILTGAQFNMTNLQEANLTNANLSGAIGINKTNMIGTILSGAIWDDGRTCAAGSVSVCK